MAEGIHGIDISWLHHPNPNRDIHHHRSHAPGSPGLAKDAPPRTSSHGGFPTLPSTPPTVYPEAMNGAAIQNPAENTPPPIISPQVVKTGPKRPALLGRTSSDKSSLLAPPDQNKGRRGSWISSLSAKFSSQQPVSSSPPPNGAVQPNGSTQSGNVSSVTTGPPAVANVLHSEPEERLEPYCPQPPRSATASFFSSALRRLSSGSQTSVGPKVVPTGGVCPRKVMNVDPNRERCILPELESSKLRRVAFCVDVEIASGPRYKEDGEGPEKKRKSKDKKYKERSEGEALKNPDAALIEKEKPGQVLPTGEDDTTTPAPNPDGPAPAEEKRDVSKKKEKKKKSEAERKERKEKKRRRAEENGQIPMELTRESEESSAVPTPSGSSTPRPQDRPTTDPLRIYRRCCQLRESTIIQRITDQLTHPQDSIGFESGVVPCLDLTGSRLQLADIMTLGDWLAIVPVNKLLLEDADLTDEGVRVILAGLLAAKSPQVSRRRFHSPIRGSDQKYETPKYEERAGVIEKLTLKNNPKIGKEGWKHIALFTYLCRSLRALDVSMIHFPKPFAKQQDQSNGAASQKLHAEERMQERDIADVFSKAISERLAGSRLEELIMAECSLTTQDIRKVIDGVTVAGLRRLGLAGNNIDDEGLDHVIRYVKSGVCEGLDLGGNNLRDRMGRLCQAFTENIPLWALSVAACDLTPDSLRPLFLALLRLPEFKFLDLSHNHKLFSIEPSALCLLRKYLSQMKSLKRIHLTDTSMSPAQAIGLAEVLPEVPNLAHLNILENPQLSALAHATNEATQEEACALYASLMAAVRVSDSIIAIDIDVPGQETSEVVQALAKQVVAYCLRNMEKFTNAETAGGSELQAALASGSEKEVRVPDVLLHLVGHVEGFGENHDDDDPAPDDDYIVGGTGVVKALSYCLLERAADLRRGSLAPSGTATPRSIHEQTEESTAKAKNMSKNLLGSARKIRTRLQPAMALESTRGDEFAYRRLVFLDQTLQRIIKRFEDEYPETRLPEIVQPTADDTLPDNASTHSSSPSSMTEPSNARSSVNTDITQPDNDSDSDSNEHRRPLHSRTASDVSLASKALSREEGRIHRLGQQLRQDILRGPSPVPGSPIGSRPTSSHETEDPDELKQRLAVLDEKFKMLRETSGDELLSVLRQECWDEICQRIGQNVEELRRLQSEHPEEFNTFREAQLAALANRGERTNNEEKRVQDDAAVVD